MTSRSLSSSFSYFLFLSLISLGLWGLDSRKLLSPVRNIFDTVIVPTKSSVYDVKQRLDNTFSFLMFWRNGTAKLRYFEQRVAELTVDSERLAVLEKENKDLRQQIGASDLNTYHLILAKTIGLERYLFINKGEIDGVKKGMMVLSSDALVGIIIETSPRTSKILLPTDPESKIPVKAARTGAKGILIGQFGSAILLDKVVQSEELKSNDLVITSGEGNLPIGLIIGTIDKIKKQETELFQQAEVKPILNYSHLENVFVNVSL